MAERVCINKMNTKVNISWSNNSAYAIGLITTDGNLSKDGRHIVFVSKDLSLVKLFKKCLKLKNRISIKTSGYSKGKGKYYFIQFGNVTFYRKLLSIGLSPNKSKTIKELTIPKRYFADFLRGHLDGDGTIHSYNDPIYHNSRRLYITFISASKAHIRWLRYQISKLYGIVGKIRIVPRAWKLVFAKKASKSLVHILYYNQNLPYLRRKRNIVENYL